ncbi:peptidoglycan-recognition protein [Plakobranchus ocellatus]|uniref:Peptidoglycan-recognition protein n=1 Tax=Plakobranchus ocellatus TaxID=259542 RepID=A0AAV3ZAE8_9GAST|nr:peptidoglycan-recognition protein [Plakobranchus ocellatus]
MSYVTRSEWGARAPKKTTNLKNQPVKYAFIHHSESPSECLTKEAGKTAVKNFQNYHMDTKGWDDIGYSFIIGGDGSVFEGRGWDRVGSHTKNYNSVGLGFCLIGNFMNKEPTQKQLTAVKDLISKGVTLNKLKSDYTLRGHKDVGTTDCPGDKLYDLIKTWDNY